MQPAQSQQSRTLEEIKSYYSHLWNLCDKPQENFNEIKIKFSQIKQFSNEEYVWICRCVESIVQSRYDQNKCIELLDVLPWKQRSFQRKNFDMPLLHSAVAGMKFGIVDYLIRVRRVSPNAVNHVGETPLHIAAENGVIFERVKMIGFLLKSGADPRVRAKILPNHPGGNHVINYLPKRDNYNSDTERGKASLAILEQAEKLLNEYAKRWDRGEIVIELPPIPEEEETETQQEETPLLECPSNLSRHGLFSWIKRRREGYSSLSQEDKENHLSTI